MRGGKRPGAGRPVRGPAPDGLKAGFRTSLEFAMAVINDPDAPLDAKIRMAGMALPFQHAKMAEIAGGKKGAAEGAAKRAAEGKFAVPAGPKLAVSNS